MGFPLVRGPPNSSARFLPIYARYLVALIGPVPGLSSLHAFIDTFVSKDTARNRS